MGALGPEMVEHPHQVVRVGAEIQRPLVIVAVAIAAGVPGHRMVARRERLHLIAPVAPVAADAVQEDDQFAGAGVLYGDARCGSDFIDIGFDHALRPWLTEKRAASGFKRK